ncbi:MAG: HPr family phosphocarrier protein [Defluviitaleaceae bacterium]|nr:HPr family phosphocarrier protein [Defluviitaleaceae bacterium]
MAELNISLNTVDKVKGFVNAISSLDGDFDLSSGRYVVDAKSIMGIFSLDLSKVLRLTVCDDSLFETVSAKLKDYTV